MKENEYYDALFSLQIKFLYRLYKTHPEENAYFKNVTVINVNL